LFDQEFTQKGKKSNFKSFIESQDFFLIMKK
jgi:hypothetical protein